MIPSPGNDNAPRTDWPWLPDLLREAAERFGLGVALRLGDAFGGRRIHVPKRARPDHPVALAAGIELLAWLVERGGGAALEIPLGPAARQAGLNRQIAALEEAGKSAAQIARAARVTERTVFNHRRRRKDGRAVDRRQGKLF